MNDQEYTAPSLGLPRTVSLPWASVSLCDVSRGTGTLAFASVWKSVVGAKHLVLPSKKQRPRGFAHWSQEVMDAVPGYRVLSSDAPGSPP